MNSTQLHYREATRHLEAAQTGEGGHVIAMELLAAAQVHALLACTAALTELTRDADPEAVATAVGVLRPIRGVHG